MRLGIWKRRLMKLFFHYGAGSDSLAWIPRLRVWNLLSWILIVLGLLLWAIVFIKLGG